MNHEGLDTYVKYMSVFFHVYHVDKILEQFKEVEHFDNVSTNARVRFFPRNICICFICRMLLIQ